MEDITLKPSPAQLWQLGFTTIKELETDQGILASDREEIYGCIFGRDSLITALRLLRLHRKTKDEYFLALVKKILVNLLQLQGQNVNIESGEEPGKCIHEFRTANYEHLVNRSTQPWYLYEDKTLRNFDSVDATPLLLIACYRYLQASGDEKFFTDHRPQLELALSWVFNFSDTNNDGFVDFRLHPDRKSGGLYTQNWMDSQESLFHEDGSPLVFPIAPVEVQGYTYLALRLWAQEGFLPDKDLRSSLGAKADQLKTFFNQRFILPSGIPASALDGAGKPVAAIRSSMGHCLWASQIPELDGDLDSIVEEQFVPEIAKRLMQCDLFEPSAGLRTLSSLSSHFDPASYHNGSIWPHDSSLVAEGLEQFGYKNEARTIRQALFLAWEHFGSPIELFVYNQGQYLDYCSPSGHASCKKQAWSAASLLADTANF